MLTCRADSTPELRSSKRMDEVLRQRLLRTIESLPEEQVYQVLDYMEFLEAKYAGDLQREASGLQRFAEGLQDRLRKKAMNPATLREAFQLISVADRALSSVSKAGKQLMDEFTGVSPDEAPTSEVEPGETASAEEEVTLDPPAQPEEEDTSGQG
jgi:uncharacterized protein DUF2281